MLHTRPQLVFRTASLLSALNKYLVGRHGEVSMCSKTGPTINGLHLEYRRRMATSDSSGKTVEKPDLRKASVNNKPRNVIIATCLLVIVYMYPMIFKPLFGIGQPSHDDEIGQIKRAVSSKGRPSYMPEWKSPFGPKSGSDEE